MRPEEEGDTKRIENGGLAVPFILLFLHGMSFITETL